MVSKPVMICPKCNSPNISNDFSNPGLVGTGLFNNAKVCNNCGYMGDFFPQVEADKLPQVKQIKPEEKRELVNATYGRNVVGFWIVSGPILAIISLLLLIYPSSMTRLMSLFMGIPLCIVTTVIGYYRKQVEKHSYMKIILIILLFFGMVVGPLIVFFINPST